MDTGVEILMILAPFYFIAAAKLVADGVLKGSGMMKQFMLATLTDLLLRVVLAKILSVSFGTTGIWVSWPVGWCVAAVISIVFCFTGIWNKKHKDVNIYR